MASKVLITGANGGFGRLTTLKLLEQGHQVAASIRAAETRNQRIANPLRDAGAVIVDFDVRDETQVNAGVANAIEQLGGLDVLINNAGRGVVGLQEAFTIEDMVALFEVNVFGVQRVNRAVIPHFRRQKSGLILYTSSLLGRIAVPFYGPYTASKWALEALAENYRAELSAFGIESAIIEPGGYLNSFIDHLQKPSDSERNQQYGELANAPQAALAGYEAHLRHNPQQDPANVAQVIADLIAKPAGTRPFRTVVDVLGMGDAIAPYNDMLQNITEEIYANFGTAHMLKVKLT